MICFRRIAAKWGRWIASGLVVSVLFSQVALAMYACPKLDSAAHVASMQMAGMAMDDAVGMSSMPDCHAMPGTMDDEEPQLCRAHCSSDSQSAPSLHVLDIPSLATHATWTSYLLPVALDNQPTAGSRAAYAQLDQRAGSPPIYLTLQVLRN